MVKASQAASQYQDRSPMLGIRATDRHVWVHEVVNDGAKRRPVPVGKNELVAVITPLLRVNEIILVDDAGVGEV